MDLHIKENIAKTILMRRETKLTSDFSEDTNERLIKEIKSNEKFASN